MRHYFVATWVSLAVFFGGLSPLLSKDLAVDFGYRPHLWRTLICPPDDVYKTLVTEKGTLVYDYNRLDSDFATSVRVVVDDAEKTGDQKLPSPRLPIVETESKAGDLSVLQEAFAAQKQVPAQPPFKIAAVRVGMPWKRFCLVRHWANPPAGVAKQLATIAGGKPFPIEYQIKVAPGASVAVAVALCEGWHDQPGQRVLDVNVEGAPSRTVDTVAGLGKNVAGLLWFDAKDANNDGLIDLTVAAAKNAKDKNAILNAFWVFDKPIERNDAAVLSGSLDAQAASVNYAEQPDFDSRNDFILVNLTNQGAAPKTVQPKVIVQSRLPLDKLGDDKVQIDYHEVVLCTEQIASIEKRKGGGGEEAVMTLGPITIEPGKTASFAVVCCGGGRVDATPLTTADVQKQRAAVADFWKTAKLPYGHVVVPDKGIQALFDSSIRNIWQAREIKLGLPAFQVGPTVYRGLWIVDGAFILEAATILGAGDQARAGIDYEFTFQQADGRFQILPRFFKENGIVLWTWTRHARLTQDKEWLLSAWPRVEKTVAFIRRLRKESCEDASPLNDGLMPPGAVDGGIGGEYHYEYSNVYWNLTGLKAAIDAAHWLGKDAQAAEWQKEYDDFYATFRKCERRDARCDIYGNRYLGILMAIEDRIILSGGDAESYLPCKGQWAFCHGVYPGQLFDKSDPLVKGNLDMLKAYEKEGMVTTTGWLTGGIWNYFASFYGHSLLWQGDGQKAAEVLYAYANHASPLYAWIEEQGLKNEPIRENGDFPHNWASAEFIRLTVHLLALDRGNEMHLFEGLPKQWTKPGMETRLDKIVTPFGPLSCSLRINDDGTKATLHVEPLGDATCKTIVVHLSNWAAKTPNATMTLDPKKSHDVEIPVE
jgi:hypothetical protein